MYSYPKQSKAYKCKSIGLLPKLQPPGPATLIFLYKESKAHNPIYNLEHCNDENVLVLINDYDTENYYKQFARYSLNILKKYTHHHKML